MNDLTRCSEAFRAQIEQSSRSGLKEYPTPTMFINVLRMTSAHDVGRAINPQGCEGQVEGAAAMGLGGAFLEELLVGPSGELRNPAFHPDPRE